VLLVPPEHTRSMYRADPSGVNGNSSPVDLALFVTGLAGPGRGFRDETSKETNEDAERERARFSKLRVALGEIREVTLEPGDTLYIPPFWWHHVATLDDVQTRVEEKTETVSVSLLLAFDPNGDESVHPCVEEDGYG
jgi:hypothetical protein